MVTEYLIDTSSVFSLSRDRLTKAAQNAQLCISPITFYELFRHLDEEGENGFRRARGNITKCSMLVLNDPVAEMYDRLGSRNKVCASRFEDARTIPLLLTELRNSGALRDFYSGSIVMGPSDERQINGTCQRLRERLRSEENDYVRLVGTLATRVLERSLRGRVQDVSPPAFVELALNAEPKLRNDFPSVNNQRLADAIYPFYGYALARTIMHGPSQQWIANPQVDRNDMRDSWICMHLNLQSHRVLITGDNGMRTAMEAALQHYRNGASSHGLDPNVLTDVKGLDAFRNEVLT